MTRSAVLVYGITGYTGKLIARSLKDKGLAVIGAGRREEAVRRVCEDLNLDEARCFALDEPDRIAAGLGDRPILLNAAGPFEDTALPLAQAAIAAAGAYLDIAGEVRPIAAVHGLDAEAREAGCMLMPGVGFGIAPTDLLAHALHKAMPDARRLTLAFWPKGGASRGTLQTLFKDITGPGVTRRDGHLVAERPAVRRARIDFPGGRKPAVSNPWRGDLFTAGLTTGIANIDVYTAFPAPVRAIMANRLGLGRLVDRPFVRRRIDRAIAKAKEGPSEAALAKGRTEIWGAIEGPAGHKTATLVGPEAYIFTAQCAAAIAYRIAEGAQAAGFQTPAGLFGLDLLNDLPSARLTGPA
jgi:short subunit dehydrogenase-like uncharacterized protein